VVVGVLVGVLVGVAVGVRVGKLRVGVLVGWAQDLEHLIIALSLVIYPKAGLDISTVNSV
jgi:hypothetical protein